MRKIIGAAFVSLDGVMQAPGGPTEDPTGQFTHGGWLPNYSDEVVGRKIGELLPPEVTRPQKRAESKWQLTCNPLGDLSPRNNPKLPSS